MNELEREYLSEDTSAEKVSYDADSYAAKATLSIDGSTAKCKGLLSMNSNYSASCTLTLQKKVSGEWNKVASWSSTGTISKNHSVTSGKTYRVKFSGSVKNSKGSTVGTFNEHSSSVKA